MVMIVMTGSHVADMRFKFVTPSMFNPWCHTVPLGVFCKVVAAVCLVKMGIDSGSCPGSQSLAAHTG